MESLWRRNTLIFTILSLNNIVSSQNVPAGFANRQSLQTIPSNQLINSVLAASGPNGNCHEVAPLVCTGAPEGQRGILLQERNGTPVPHTSVPPQIIPSLTLPPPILYNLQGQVSRNSCPSMSNPFPNPATTPLLPGMPPSPPYPLAIPAQPILSELTPRNCPPHMLGNQFIPFQQQQISFDNILPNPVLPEVYLLSSNIQQNLTPNSPGSTTVVPFSQTGFIPVNNCPLAPAIPEVSPQVSSFLTPSSYPTFLYPGTCSVISTLPQYSIQNSIVPDSTDVKQSQSGYQVTVLPSVLPVQTASESVSSSTTYSYAPAPTGAENLEQRPINVQISFPEPPAPMAMPPLPPAPIIVVKSGSKWKSWLPSLLVTLLTNCRGCQGCGCCCGSSCDSSNNVYVPFPIPVPTNNPIILGGNSPRDGDDGEDEYCED